MQDKKLCWVQVLRAIAAIMVAILHFYVVYNYNSSKDYIFDFNKTLYPIAYIFVRHASFGVDLFFVLSGFIMYYTLRSFSTNEFLINRISRIYPVFAVSMLAFLLLKFQYFLNAPLVFIPQMLFMPLGGPQPGLTPGYNGVIWTLNYEMYFYLMMGLSLLFKKHWFKALNIYFLITLLVIPFLTFRYITFSASGYDFGLTQLKFGTNPMIFEFWIGLFIAYLFYDKKITFNKYIFNVMSVIIILAFLFFYITLPLKEPYWGLTGIGIFAPFLVLIFVYDDLNKVIKFAPPRWMVKLGDMSYSIYLWHTFILEAVYKYFYSNVPGFIIPPGSHNPILIFYRGTPREWFLPIYLLVVLLVSAASYHLFEVKATKAVRAFLKGKFLKKST